MELQSKIAKIGSCFTNGNKSFLMRKRKEQMKLKNVPVTFGTASRKREEVSKERDITAVGEEKKKRIKK